MATRLAAIAVLVLSACQEKDRPPSATPQAVLSLSASVSVPADGGGQKSRPDHDGGAIPDGGRLATGDGGPTLPVLSATRTIASLRPNFRACYNEGLRSDPSMVGSVLETVTVNANGTVAATIPSQIEGLDAEVIACFGRALRTAHFPPPGIDGSTLKLPITFRKGTATVSDAGDLPPYVDPVAGRAPPP